MRLLLFDAIVHFVAVDSDSEPLVERFFVNDFAANFEAFEIAANRADIVGIGEKFALAALAELEAARGANPRREVAENFVSVAVGQTPIF